MSLPIEATRPLNRTNRALRRARLAQFAFWGLSAAAAASVVVAVYVSRMPHTIAVGAKVSRATPELPDQQLAKNNQVGGLDSANLPFSIKTLKGFQDKSDRELYHLQDVAGTFRRENGKDLAIAGNIGTYQTQKKVLNLEGSVVVREAPRFEARMEKAVFDLNQHSLSSDSPVHVKLDNGTIEADSLIAENNGEKMTFKGNVTAHFNNNAASRPQGEQQ